MVIGQRRYCNNSADECMAASYAKEIYDEFVVANDYLEENGSTSCNY